MATQQRRSRKSTFRRSRIWKWRSTRRSTRRPWRSRGGGRHRFRGSPIHDPPYNPKKDVTLEEIGTPTKTSLCVAIEGCCHGALDGIYDRLLAYQERTGRGIDLLLCCGDFQGIRNVTDLHSIAVPAKYRALGSFYKYYSGEKLAPFLTVFIGGNHEASQPLEELYYGGWVAPRMYYMGAASVLRYRGMQIGGISGIYKPHDYELGRFEKPPYDRSTKRSVYHVRNIDVYRMKCFAASALALRSVKDQRLDIVMSHDWPRGIEQHGDSQGLIRQKPFFRSEINSNTLGSPANEELLQALKPHLWFSAHLHVKFKATVKHATGTQCQSNKRRSKSPPAGRKQRGSSPEGTTKFIGLDSKQSPCAGPDLTDLMTKFMSLDKCLPRRHCISILHYEPKGATSDRSNTRHNNLEYDPLWLAVLQKTHTLSNTTNGPVKVPDDLMVVTPDDLQRVPGPFVIDPSWFHRTVPAHQGSPNPDLQRLPRPYAQMGNPQTDRLLQQLGLPHIVTIPYTSRASPITVPVPAESDDGDEDVPDALHHDSYHDEDEINLDMEETIDSEANHNEEGQKKARLE